ncbi:hypothetical protein FOA52_010920 [Chlamydomonas sp. UWO 241]|nr:hypothetical protein FOA52_010920 [Chlamydomonas sp. UWO 241]
MGAMHVCACMHGREWMVDRFDQGPGAKDPGNTLHASACLNRKATRSSSRAESWPAPWSCCCCCHSHSHADGRCHSRSPLSPAQLRPNSLLCASSSDDESRKGHSTLTGSAPYSQTSRRGWSLAIGTVQAQQPSTSTAEDAETAAPAAQGGATTTAADTQASTSIRARPETLTLRLVPRRKKKSVKWTDDTVEVNEFMGKKSSKKCCIFHRRRTFGDWSDEDDSDFECDDPNCSEPGKDAAGGGGGPAAPLPTAA